MNRSYSWIGATHDLIVFSESKMYNFLLSKANLLFREKLFMIREFKLKFNILIFLYYYTIF